MNFLKIYIKSLRNTSYMFNYIKIANFARNENTDTYFSRIRHNIIEPHTPFS